MVEEQTEKINFLMDAMTEMSRLETGLVSLHSERQPLPGYARRSDERGDAKSAEKRDHGHCFLPGRD